MLRPRSCTAECVHISEGEDEAVKQLVLTAKRNPGAWDHTVSRLRQDRKTADAFAATVRRLTDAGVAFIDHPARGQGPVGLDNLVDGDGNVLDADSHAACPGHAAAVSEYPPTTSPTTASTPPPTATGPLGGSGHDTNGGRRKDDRGSQGRPAGGHRDNNKQWKAAEPVRRAWIRDLLARTTPPKATLRFAVGEVLAEPDRVGDGKDALLADLLRRPEPHGWGRSVGAAATAEVGEARLALVLLAQVAADREATMNEGTWRNANPSAARWFMFLASAG